MKNLVIVESPSKAKTIEKYLGKDYTVMSSFGHIRDLSKKDLEIGKDFSVKYEVPDEKRDLVRRLKNAAKEAETVWLASDEDREGEAIAWHLYEVLKLKPENTRRIVFHEITKPALLHAISNPRSIDLNLVNAQQARRVLDRVVGFELSNVLWRKIKPSLSAGRVQSVAVRLICEREKEISAFRPEAYYRVTAVFTDVKSGAELKAECTRRFPGEAEARKFLGVCREAMPGCESFDLPDNMIVQDATASDAGGFRVSDVTVKPLKRSPQPPFTTSTLQQEASRRLGMSVNQTMMIAQKLYEDGKITYMRTDSLNLSDLALKDIADTVSKEYGKENLKSRRYHTSSKGAQEAHEAIRPTYVSNRTVSGSANEQRLYDLIWRRAVASQMADAAIEKTIVEIEAGHDSETQFRAEGEVIRFAGFMQVYSPDASSKEERLPALSAGDILDAVEINATERFTQAPARYTEASLVKKMEELGIGRPSTYAPTISTIQARDYVARGEKEGEARSYRQLHLVADGTLSETELAENTGSEKGKLVPTDVGMIVNDFLTEYFPEELDYNFTANVEQKFDEIAEGELPWKEDIVNFYGEFHPKVMSVQEMRTEHKVGERILGTDPKSGRQVSVKIGRYGPLVQIGEATDADKPLFASLKKDQSISTITLEEALKLFELPRDLGLYESKKVVAAVGKFGPYVRFDGKFVSIPSGLAPESITLEEAVELIEQKRAKDAAAFIKDFPEIPGLTILNGRYGPYMSYKPEGSKRGENFKLPKDVDPQSITAEQAKAIMEQPQAPARKRASRKK